MDEINDKGGVYYDRDDYAGLLKRIIIAVVDLLVILIVMIIVVSLSRMFMSNEEDLAKVIFISFISISLFYLAILKPSKYRTLGYIMADVKIVNLKGNKPSLFTMLLRASLLLIGPFELIFDIIWLTSETTKQTLRDKYVGTYVVNRNALPTGKGPLRNVTLGVLGWYLTYQEVKIP